MQHYGEKILCSLMIPRAWKTAGHDPAILDAETSCNNVGSLDYVSLQSETASKTDFCWDNSLYYLVSPDFEGKDEGPVYFDESPA